MPLYWYMLNEILLDIVMLVFITLLYDIQGIRTMLIIVYVTSSYVSCIPYASYKKSERKMNQVLKELKFSQGQHSLLSGCFRLVTNLQL